MEEGYEREEQVRPVFGVDEAAVSVSNLFFSRRIRQ